MSGPTQGAQGTGGLSGVLRVTAIMAIIVLALLVILVVFDVIPRERLADYSGKVLLTAGVVAVAAVGIGVLVGSRRS